MSVVLYWFRNDLRLADNPALSEAAAAGEILPIYIYGGDCGAASRCWLHHSLCSLSKSLAGHLHCLSGDAQELLPNLCRKYGVSALYYSRSYHPKEDLRDQALAVSLREVGVAVQSFSSRLLWSPESVLKDDGTPYKIFTPYYKRALKSFFPPSLGGKKPNFRFAPIEANTPDSLGLLSQHPWEERVLKSWQIGEEAAFERLQDFLRYDLHQYDYGRDFPGEGATSKLSPHLHFGEISPLRLWVETEKYGADANGARFKSELAWRDFSYYIHYYFPELPSENFKKKYDTFAWQSDDEAFDRWCRGETGIPLVDAGMRELWQTGFIHNRVRMIVASFLVKNLLIDWRKGAAWFMECLLDADEASNSAGWQWVAGSGTDAAPYFRIFNPVSQGKKFDGLGRYTKKYLPELANLDNKHLFAPWELSQKALRDAGVTLGKEYPFPLVDLADSRRRALAAYAALTP